ncbi:MAG: hypothetical protein R2764_22300 [Bacteroidales bacterium]
MSFHKTKEIIENIQSLPDQMYDDLPSPKVNDNYIEWLKEPCPSEFKNYMKKLYIKELKNIKVTTDFGKIDFDRYDRYVLGHPKGTIFHKIRFLLSFEKTKILSRSLSKFSENNRIVGTFRGYH